MDYLRIIFYSFHISTHMMIHGASLAILVAVICVSTRHSDQTESDSPIFYLEETTIMVQITITDRH